MGLKSKLASATPLGLPKAGKSTNERQEGMARKTGLTLLVLGVALAVFAAACGNDKTKPSGGSTTPPATSPPPTPTTFTEAEWTIVTPAGWTREDATSSADAKKAVRYSDAEGNYFMVAIDPLGSGYSYDVLWNYTVKGTSFEIATKTECTAGDEACATTDNRFTGYILWKTGTQPQKVGGHVWYFVFGNSQRSTVADTSVFEQIAESLVVKS